MSGTIPNLTRLVEIGTTCQTKSICRKSGGGSKGLFRPLPNGNWIPEPSAQIKLPSSDGDTTHPNICNPVGNFRVDRVFVHWLGSSKRRNYNGFLRFTNGILPTTGKNGVTCRPLAASCTSGVHRLLGTVNLRSAGRKLLSLGVYRWVGRSR